MTPINFTGFEVGLSAYSTSGSGLVNTIVGSPTISSTYKHSGDYSMRCNPSSGTAYFSWGISTQRIVARFHFYFDSLPTGSNTYICAPCHLTGQAYPMIGYNPSTNKLFAGFNGVAYSQGSIDTMNADQWYCIDLDADISIDQHTIDWKIDGTAQTQAVCLTGGTAYTGTAFRIGAVTTTTSDTYIDDIIYSYNSGDYPFALDTIQAKRPDADGSHNAGTNVIEDGDGNDIDGSSTYAYDHLEENPWVSTAGGSDLVRQFATGTGNYAEVGFANTSKSNIIGVMAYLQYSGSGTTANSGACEIYSSTTMTELYGNHISILADYSEATSFYKRCIVNPYGGGAWTTSLVNALLCRMGYSDNVATYPYWQAVILEVAAEVGEEAGETLSINISPEAGTSRATGIRIYP